MKVYVNLPVGTPNTAGDYPVDHDALRRKVCPCLVHMLDAFFAGLVVEKLNELGVRNLVSIHDCWLVPKSAEATLKKAVTAAGEPWLRGLGPIYDRLEHYLGEHDTYGPLVRAWRAQWERRVANREWPDFRVDPSDLIDLHSESF